VFCCVSWLDLGGWGRYNMVLEIHFSTLSLDGPGRLSEAKFYGVFISKWSNFELQNIHGKK
jgi:hypothetical protein